VSQDKKKKRFLEKKRFQEKVPGTFVSSYGVPDALPAGDTDSDGDFDASDVANIGDGTYTVVGDVDLDGDEDIFDILAATAETLGYGVLSGIDNRHGYAGYEFADELLGTAAKYHVRHRFYMADLGQWSRRDPMGYLDGMSLYSYVQGLALIATDPQGLLMCVGGSCLPVRSTPIRPEPGIGSPPACAGGTCSIPIAPPTGPGGGLDPFICVGGVCSTPTPGLPNVNACGQPEDDGDWTARI